MTVLVEPESQFDGEVFWAQVAGRPSRPEILGLPDEVAAIRAVFEGFVLEQCGRRAVTLSDLANGSAGFEDTRALYLFVKPDAAAAVLLADCDRVDGEWRSWDALTSDERMALLDDAVAEARFGRDLLAVASEVAEWSRTSDRGRRWHNQTPKILDAVRRLTAPEDLPGVDLLITLGNYSQDPHST